MILPVAQATGTIRDDDEAELTELSIGDVSVPEGDSGSTPAVFPLALSRPASGPVSVALETAAGTAQANLDFTPASGSVAFAAGATTSSVTVPVVGDRVLEADETFEVRLSAASGATIADGSGEGRILDDELCAGPNLLAGVEVDDCEDEDDDPDDDANRVLPASGDDPDDDGHELTRDVDLSAYQGSIDAGHLSFRFAIQIRTHGTTQGDVVRVIVEYRDAARLVVLDQFDSGEVASPDAWRWVEDERLAPVGTRWVRVRLATVHGCGEDDCEEEDDHSAAPASGGGDDDCDDAHRRTKSGDDDETTPHFQAAWLSSLRTATLAIGDASVYEGDTGETPAPFALTLNCPVEQPVTCTFATANGTALAGQDYRATSGTATVPARQITSQITVPVLGDAATEPTETFKLNLANVVGAAAPDRPAIGSILDDDFCQRSPGYWKNHRSAWPVSALTLGGVRYNATALMGFLQYGGSEGSRRLARHLTATKLNLAAGSEPSILPTVQLADAFLAAHPPGSNPQDEALTEANRIKDLLDAYNNACAH